MKKRILLVNDSSLLSTGYAAYGRELLAHFNNEEYEMAELACFCDGRNPKISNLKWKHFPTIPKNPPPEFHSNPENRWGKWEFENTCLNFKPHFVIDIRDWWNFEWQSHSPARPYFNWGILAPVDSIPQREEWLSTFSSAEGLFTYTDWGTDVLKGSLGDNIKSFGSAPPGVSKQFCKMDRLTVRQKMGIPRDINLIGTVMRNQIRKLYPDLIEAFADFLHNAPKEIASKTYLYLHGQYPDVGWDFPKLIKNYGVASRTYFTYKCSTCQKCFSSFYQGVRVNCKFCDSSECRLPTWDNGVSTEQLAEIYNLFDVYAQYAVCGGFEIPQIEAAACGIPVFSVDYSAMSEVVRRVGGYPINVKRMFHDAGTSSIRALPDNDHFNQLVLNFLMKPVEVRNNISFKTNDLVRKNYPWEKTLAAWSKFFDSQPLDKWEKGAKIHTPKLKIPQELSHTDFVNWCAENVAGRKDLVNSFLCLQLARDLDNGYFIKGLSEFGGDKVRYQKINRDVVLQYFADMVSKSNNFEKRRLK